MKFEAFEGLVASLAPRAGSVFVEENVDLLRHILHWAIYFPTMDMMSQRYG